MLGFTVSDIKHAQKEALFFQAIAEFYQQLCQDDSRLVPAFITRVKLSPDRSLCTVYFYCAEGKEAFAPILDILKLYRPSLRKSLAAKLNQRHTPELRFAFDETMKKQEHIENILKSVIDEVQTVKDDTADTDNR